jgi:hypothetical protein
MEILVRILKFLAGLLLLPACVAVTIVFSRDVLSVLKTEYYFFAGLFAYLVLLGIFQQPIRTYVFGHELTHALWVWICGGTVKRFRVSASGGGVRADKANALIYLAPYFFPIYSILLIPLFLLVDFFVPVPGGMRILAVLLGFTWAFHITFTIYVLFQGQPDIGATGAVFSLPLIYFANVLSLACLVIFVTPAVTYGAFFGDLWTGVRETYRFLGVNAPTFCRDCADWCRSRVEDVIG